MKTIDLNADLGEGPGEEALYPLVTSANVACGGHAGDERSMREAIGLCLAHGVAVGAHPSYPDRSGFGRRSLVLPHEALADVVAVQVDALCALAAALGARVRHVKPHGALYNDAARRPTVAAAVAEGVRRVSRELILVGLAGAPALDLWREQGWSVAAEGFADRGYEEDGSLVPRDRPGAVLVEAGPAAAQALRLARAGTCDTLCVHSDTPGAARLLGAVRAGLLQDGWTLAALAERKGPA